MREPSLKQRNFVDEYLKTFSPAKSYRVAYNPPTMNDNSLNVEACRLLKSETIQRMLREKMTSAKPKSGELSPEYIKEKLKHAIDHGESEGAVVSALNVSSKCFGMQTMKTEDVTESMRDTDLILALVSAHYQVPVQDYDELDDEDKELYSQLIKRVNGGIYNG